MRRRAFQALLAGVSCSSLVACAALTGLDQITEDPCAPDGCNDVASAGDVRTPDGAVHDDATSNPESGGGLDGISGADADGASRFEAASGEAGADGPRDAVPEVSDGSSDATAASDAPSDTVIGNDAPADSPCGTVYLSESFDTSGGGWTLDSSWSIAPTCASPPAPQKGNADPTVDHTTGTAGGVAGVYVCGNNPTGATSPLRYATSPAVDVSAAPAVVLQFYRWLNSDADGWMTSTVDVFDGTAWVNVYTNPSGSGNIVADSAWTRVEYDVTAQKNGAFRVRFGYAVTDAGVYSMSCWNVDDVTVSSTVCP
jgi:hypothetical protein